MNHDFDCPCCGEKLTAQVDLGEHFADFEEQCYYCGTEFDEGQMEFLTNKILEDCAASQIDAADMLKER